MLWPSVVLYAATLASLNQVVAQQPTAALASTVATIQPGQPAVLNGVVLNAITKQPVGRVLIQAGPHSVLSGHDGKFQFTDESGSSASLRVTKPGFYDGPEPGSSSKRILFGSTADPLTIYLYPEALITGSLQGPDDEPLANVFVEALRRSGDESGTTWTVAGQTFTNSDGQFRLPLSAGDYVLETHYLPDLPGRQMALLPTVVPDAVNNIGEGSQPAIHLESGTERHLELRPQLRPLHKVQIRSDEAANRMFPQVEAHLPNGLSFFPTSRPVDAPGEFTTSLPTGSYTLTVASNQGEIASYAETAVDVGDKDVAGIVMHSVQVLPMPVEVDVDTSTSTTVTSDNPAPTVQQLGLRFLRTDRGAPSINENAYLRVARGESAAFNLTPGRYRLLAQPLSPWFVESATVGGTDLLTQDFDAASGGTTLPLRIVVSNNTGAIKGNVKLDGIPGVGCWVYFIQATRGLTPMVYAISGNDGSFSRMSLAPGSYLAVAFETRRSADFTDPATLERLASYMKSVTVAAGEVAALDIDAIPSLELN